MSAPMAPSTNVGAGGGEATRAAAKTDASKAPAATAAIGSDGWIGRRDSLRLPRVAADDPLGDVRLGRGVWFDANRFGGDTDVHVIGADVLGRDGIGPDHCVAAHPYPGKNSGMVGDSHIVLQHGSRVGDIALVHDAVSMTVDVG